MNTVVWDDEKGGYLATNHLIELGKNRILFLNGPSYISSSEDRCNGYKRALTEHHLPVNPRLIVNVDTLDNSAYEILKGVMQSNILFDAIFAFSDFIAWEAISMLRELGKRVPDDIPIVGFDDIQSHLKIPMPLTSIGADKTEEAEAAVRILLGQIKGGHDNKACYEVIDTMLVKREST